MHIVEKEFKSFIELYKETKTFNIAYSGGVDSQVLLHLSNKYIQKKIKALHVNHSISKNSLKWQNFCEKTASFYNIDLETKTFNLKDVKSNLEEKARELRYAFFSENIDNESVIMTGHHLDDQAETFILRLMRGAGVDGLSSMSAERQFDKGLLIRPLLTVSKEEIIDYAKSENLEWVEDESNKDTHYDRNFIRNEVMPLLKTRWSHANKSIARSAKHCEKTKKQTASISELNLSSVYGDHRNKIDLSKLLKYSKEEQKNVIRTWLKTKEQKMPNEKALNSIIEDVLCSSIDSSACFETKTYSIKKSFNTIYYVPLGQKITFSTNIDIIKDFPSNRNSLKMFYNGSYKKVKTILKEEKVPQWERGLYPIYIIEGEISAIGDIYSDAETSLVITKKYKT